MPRQRKTDKYRQIEGRGIGREKHYRSWIETHELSPKSRTIKIKGWKTGRIHQLLSDQELYFFLSTQWEDNTIDIREQYPLLPIEQTIVIANELGIRHPKIIDNNRKRIDAAMTTDFVITKKDGNLIYDIARDVKMSTKLNNRRTCEKFDIVKRYWDINRIDWGIVTENEISKVKGRNILFLYDDYYWANRRMISEGTISNIITEFKDRLIQFNFDIYRTIEVFECYKGWSEGEGLNFFKYLLIRKRILTDFNVRLNFETMKIYLP